MPSTQLVVWAGNVSDVTASDANLTWFSHTLGTGYGPVAIMMEAAFRTKPSANPAQSEHSFNPLYRVLIELHGLSPWSKYTVTVGVTTEPTGVGGLASDSRTPRRSRS